jgi:hypothetical protein
MTTTILIPGGAIDGAQLRDNPAKVRPCSAVETQIVGEAPVALLAAERPEARSATDSGSGMSEDETVSVLEVLEEMQRIIDRHIEKTENRPGGG